jgi:DNA-directed RNA polymerase beta' subunit
MNMHVPQSIQTMMELKYLAAVQHHFISPSTNSPIIAPSQDNLLGAFLMTDDDVELTQTEATHLLSGTQSFNGILPEPAIREGKRIRWTGKQIYSVILPPLTLRGPSVEKGGPDFVVKNGIIQQGRIFKKVSNMLMQAIHSEFGAKETARYINDLQYVISRFLIKNGFSLGISDMIIHPDIKQSNKERLMSVFDKEKEIMRKVHLNILDDNGTGDFSKVYENECMQLMNAADDDVADNTMEKLSISNNRVKAIVASGAKGKKLNIKQMVCQLGQQVIEGERVPMGFNDRTLPHYPRYENGLESRGFITGNFIDGINPQEFFFHAISGRIGLIDTAVKTAKSGYLQRKLVKMMEDLRAYHDASIRDSNNNIIEFCYGTDGFDGMKLENQKTKFAFISKEELLNNYLILEKDEDDMKSYVLTKTINKMKKDHPKWLDECNEFNKKIQFCLDLLHVEMFKINGEVVDKLLFPANIPKLISKAKTIYGLEDCKVKSNMHFLDVINRIELCLEDCSINGKRNNVLMILLYDYLSPKRVLRDYKFNADALEFVCSQIYLGFQKGLVNPGEMVGPVAAQSIGEQSTQMSVLRNTLLMVSKLTKSGKHKMLKLPIGELVDNVIKNRKDDDIIGFPREKDNMNNVFIRPTDDYFVLTVNKENRKLEWQRISEFSRHPANGGMVKVTTLSGREITTTLSHSHLENTADKIVKKNGSDLKIGDRIPIVMNNKLISENTSITISGLDNKFELNELTGWFFGAYLSEGSINGNQITITSNKPIVKEKLEQFTNYVNGYKFKQRIKENTLQNKNYIGIDNIFTSKPIAKFTIDEFGKGSANKFIPEWVFNSNKTFIKHLIRAYIDYDGNVNAVLRKETIRVHSISKKLINDIAYLLSYFGIATTFGVEKGSKISTSEIYTLKVLRKHLLKYYELIGTDLDSNKKKFENIKELFTERKQPTDYIDSISNVGKLLSELAKPLNVDGYSRNFKRYETRDIGRECLKKKIQYLKEHPNSDKLDTDKLALLETHVDNDIIWDKIVKIEYLDDPKELVYDIGVIGNHTFATFTGIITHNTLNTFHTAGTGAKVTAGVPRMEEILSVTSNPKNPSNILYLMQDSMFNKDKAEVIKNAIAQVTIGRILKSDPEFYLEPSSKIENALEEDMEFMAFYELFSEVESDKKEIKNNPWVIRLAFDRRAMINHNISMADVNLILQSEYPDSILMYSDDNASKLVFRIKMPFETKLEVEDDIKLLKNKVEEIKNIIIKGVDNIKSAFLNNITDKSDKNDYVFIDGKKSSGYSKPGDVYTSKKEFVITTEGSNLFELLIRDDIDDTRSYTIEPNEMWSIFGIEACKFVLLQQFMRVLSDSGVSINPRHVCLLVNKMIHAGEPYPINIYGVWKEDSGPLAKASFERPMEFFKNAALFGEVDELKGVSANIMVGQIPNCGTGSVRCYLDEEALMEGLKKRGLTKSQAELEITEEQLLKEFEQRICVSEDDKIRINMTDVQEDGINLDMIPTVSVE